MSFTDKLPDVNNPSFDGNFVAAFLAFCYTRDFSFVVKHDIIAAMLAQNGIETTASAIENKMRKVKAKAKSLVEGSGGKVTKTTPRKPTGKACNAQVACPRWPY